MHDLNDSVPSYHPLVPDAVTPSGDVTITSRQRTVQAGVPVLGFVAGGTDPQNYYFVQWVAGGGNNGMKLYRMQGGVSFTLIATGTGADPVVGQWYDMKLEITGTTMKVFIDGAERLTATLPAYTGGKVGLLTYQGSRNEYDDVTISGEGYLPSGTYTSSVFDAGASALWGQAQLDRRHAGGHEPGRQRPHRRYAHARRDVERLRSAHKRRHRRHHRPLCPVPGTAVEQRRHRHTPPPRHHPGGGRLPGRLDAAGASRRSVSRASPTRPRPSSGRPTRRPTARSSTAPPPASSTRR